MKLRNALNFDLRQAIRMRLENLTSNPPYSSSEHGRLWLNSPSKRAQLNNGTDVVELRDSGTPIVNGDIGASAGIALSKLATDPLARGNHTGSQAASTISDFHAQVRTNRLDQMAAPTAAVAMGSQKITGLAAGTAPADAVNRGQMLDEIAAAAAGVRKGSVRAATTGNVTIATALNAGDVIDGQTLANGDRVLVKDQASPAQNGIYVVGATPARAPDMNVAEQVDGAQVLVEDGTVNVGTTWYTTSDVVTLGTDPIVWVARNFLADLVAGAGLAKSGNTVSIANGGVTTDHIGLSQVTTNRIANNAVGQEKIADGAIVYRHFGDDLLGAGLGWVEVGLYDYRIGIETRDGLQTRLESNPPIYEGQVLGLADNGVDGVKLADNTVPPAKLSAAVPVTKGGTGATTATAARTALGAVGKYSSATHAAGTSISITAATHGLGAGRDKHVTLLEEATGEVVYADVTIAANGNVTVTFDASEAANSIRVTVIG